MEEVTSKDLQYITNQMEDIKILVKETNSSVKNLESDFTNHKIYVNERMNSHITYSEALKFGAWIVATFLTCVGIVAAFFSLK